MQQLLKYQISKALDKLEYYNYFQDNGKLRGSLLSKLHRHLIKTLHSCIHTIFLCTNRQIVQSLYINYAFFICVHKV